MYEIMEQTSSAIPIDIKMVEAHYSAKFIGDFCIKSGDRWTDYPVAIFYQASPKTELGHSNYFGLLYIEQKLMILNGESAFSNGIVGAISNSGEVIYSRYRHDHVTSKDGSVSIDGGRDYTSVTGNFEVVMLKINKDKLEIQ